MDSLAAARSARKLFPFCYGLNEGAFKPFSVKNQPLAELLVDLNVV